MSTTPRPDTVYDELYRIVHQMPFHPEDGGVTVFFSIEDVKRQKRVLAEARALPLLDALRVLRDMSDDLADAVLTGIRPADIGVPDWEAANESFQAALSGASREEEGS